MSINPDKLVQQWVRDEIRALSAYHVPDAQGMIKLDAMENPYQWPHGMREDWLDSLHAAHINRYPDAASAQLRQSLRESMHIPAGLEILLGNGSDELIQIIAMALAAPGRAVLAPAPSFVMYEFVAKFVAMQYVSVALREDFALDGEAMLEAIKRHQPALIFLAYPNNPTGNLFDRDVVDAIIQSAPGLVVMDEAYHAFAGDSYLNNVERYPNLLVLRTVSKMGLAGLRLGYLVGHAQWLQEFDKMRLPYNINVLTQVTAEFALKNRAVLDKQTQQICQDRAQLFADLQALPQLKVYPSHTNFILFKTPSGCSADIYRHLIAQGVLIKNLGAQPGALQDCLRVTVGTAEENAAFIQALKSGLPAC